MGAVAFDLLVGGDGAEDDLCKLARIEGAVRYSSVPALADVRSFRGHVLLPDHFQRMFYDGHREMCAVINQSCNVVLWHLGELLLKDAFEPRQDDDAVAAIVIVDHAELDLPFTFLYHCGLWKLC